MYELNLQDYGQLKQGQLCHVSVVVSGAVSQIVWLSASWEHGGCISWLPYALVGPLISSGQYVVIASDACSFWSGMLICQCKPFQESFFFLLHSPLSAWVSESPSQAFIVRQRGLDIHGCFSTNETFFKCPQSIHSSQGLALLVRGQDGTSMHLFSVYLYQEVCLAV